MPQLIVNSNAGECVEHSGTIDVDFPDVLADLDVEVIPDEVIEYGRQRIGETEETRTKLLAELEDMIYGKV